MQKTGENTKTKVSEVYLLREVLLDLLQPVQSVLSLQVNLRVLKMVPNDSPYPKTWGLQKKPRSLACLEVELLHEELHHLLRPSTTILDTLTMCSYCCSMCSEFVYTYVSYPDHPKKPEKNRLCKTPPMSTTVI